MIKLPAVPPENFSDCAEVIKRLDACFVNGFSRLGEAHKQTLDSLPLIFNGTPLQDALAKAVEAVGQ
ncbi:MAG: hypothetical protein GY862_16805, partial [Gammaproteobacteria bacterium]|nr:hypothetical protein [Gammaproteobacteria bacterium]